MRIILAGSHLVAPDQLFETNKSRPPLTSLLEVLLCFIMPWMVVGLCLDLLGGGVQRLGDEQKIVATEVLGDQRVEFMGEAGHGVSSRWVAAMILLTQC